MYARLGNQTKQNAKLQENYKETIQKNLRSQLQHQNTLTIYAAASEHCNNLCCSKRENNENSKTITFSSTGRYVVM